MEYGKPSGNIVTKISLTVDGGSAKIIKIYLTGPPLSQALTTMQVHLLRGEPKNNIKEV
jgi:hypothetical protein